MERRKLGATGIEVGVVGLGCEAFAECDDAFAGEMIDLAFAAGANCIDLYSPAPGLRDRIGAALQGRREQAVLQAHLCTIWRDGQYKRTRNMAEVREGFEDLLARLGTDRVEIGMIHYVDSVEDWERIETGEILAYARQLKAEGRIGAIGLSSHNPAAARAAVESGAVEVLMFSVNPCYDLLPASEDVESLWADASYEGRLLNMDPDRARLYETCQQRGVGITVMKAFGGGDLLSDQSPAGRALTVHQCIHYALDRPGVACVLSGARTPGELEAGLSYCKAGRAERDYAAALAALPKISWQGHCMYCGHCAPCPAGIDVAVVSKFLHLARAQGGVPETVREHYAVLPAGAGACSGCGACEGRCPFGVAVRENMRQAAALFGR